MCGPPMRLGSGIRRSPFKPHLGQQLAGNIRQVTGSRSFRFLIYVANNEGNTPILMALLLELSELIYVKPLA